MNLEPKRISMLTLLFALILITSAGGGKVAAVAVGDTFTYLPLIHKPYGVDLVINGYEVSQSVQKSNNSIPLVSNKPTIVRIFAQTAQGPAQTGVTVSVTGYRNGSPLGTVSDGPKTVPLSPARSDYGSTFNVALPSAWLSGSVELVAAVDSGGVIPEDDEGNNTASFTINFNSVPALDVKIVPINYTHTPTGVYYPGQAVDYISGWIARAYPVAAVNISFRASYNFVGDLRSSNEWVRLLNEVTALKSTDNAPSSQVYYAFVPISNGASQWFHSGIAGVGWIGWPRASVGLNLGAQTDTAILAAHEIGHNLGREHAPCGVSNPDVNYPYGGASIGEYGLDIVLPSVTLLNPGAYVDMMSYCSPEWLSDYTYIGLYNDQQAKGLYTQSATVNSLFVRAELNERGEAIMKPIYTFPAAPTQAPSSSPYEVQLVDGSGRLIMTQPAHLLVAEEEGLRAAAVQAVLPVPDAPVAAVRLVRAGQTVGERRLLTQKSPAAAAAPSLSQRNGQVELSWGMLGSPALVRFSADNGESWTTVGMDLVEGRLSLSLEALPAANGRFEVILGDRAVSLTLTAELLP